MGGAVNTEAVRERLRRRLLVYLRMQSDQGDIPADTLRDLLQAIGEGHSLSSAARKGGKSWRHAWGVIQGASKALQVPLVESVAGGPGGGGSGLTEAGRATLEELRHCSRVIAGIMAPPGVTGDTHPLILLAATLESVETGLMDVISRTFFRDRGILLGIIAAGSGTALALAEEGRVDLAFTHAPEQEKHLVERGVLELGIPTMRSRYVIVGPAHDPAGITGARESGDPLEAVRRIARSENAFVSRGDNSGTHLRELALWRAAGMTPAPPWYRRAGESGNRAVLLEAAASDAYALVDQATVRRWGLARKQAVLYSDPADRPEELLEDLFSLLRVRSTAGTGDSRGYRYAGEFLAWLEREKDQLIRTAAVDSTGAALFEPCAG
ncbi:MAG: hypothetical protein EA427_14115 [Spirochaetaceae bacterium]|nr:MAG: hypothetical protein EA427_14115 [Spirochaetaceae bacterium]